MKIGKHTAIFVLSMAAAAFLLAEPKITARVSSTEVSVGNSITLSLEISGISNIDSPPNISISGFQVERGGQTQSYQWVNGQTSSLIAFQYLLTPNQPGTFTIPSLTLTNGGNKYTSDPIQITVTAAAQGNAAPAQQPQAATPQNIEVPSEGIKPVFMTASVDKSKSYVGQQILLKIQFLRRPSVALAAQPRYTEPDMTGFLVEPLKQQEYTSTLNGAQYIVTELRYALFPTSDGDFAIGSATIDLALRVQADPFDPNSFFQNFFGRSQATKLNTHAIPIHVRALPKNKPFNYSGAVGRFKISAKVDNTEPEAGKPINLTVSIDGVGNIKTIKEPMISELKSFKRYETISTSKVNNEDKFLHGSKEFKILLIPQVSGALTIPAIPFSYFNPEQNDFETIATNEITLHVKPGTFTQDNRDVTSQTTTSGQAAEGVRVVEKDIRFIKPGRVYPIKPPVYLRGGFILFSAIPPIFALAATLSMWRTRKRSLFASHYRSKEAFKKAQKQIKKSRACLDAESATEFYAILYSALTDFIADKLDISATGLIWDDLNRRLSERGVEPGLCAAIREILDDADMARFSGTSFTSEQKTASLATAQRIIDELNKVL